MSSSSITSSSLRKTDGCRILPQNGGVKWRAQASSGSLYRKRRRYRKFDLKAELLGEYLPLSSSPVASHKPIPSKIGNMDLQIGMLLFPQLTQLDLAGPFEVLSRLSETRVLLLWKSLESITSDTGMSILPTTTFGSVRNSTLYSCRADQVRSH